MRAACVMTVLLALIPASLFNPFVGVLAWYWLAYFNPQRLSWGFIQQVPVALAIAAPTIVGFFFTKRRTPPYLTTETLLLVVLWIWFVVTTATVYYSPLYFSHFDQTLFRLKDVSKILGMTFLTLMLITERNRLRWLCLVTGGTFGVLAVKGAIFATLSGGGQVSGPANTSIGDNNDFAMAMNMILPLLGAVYATETRKIIRIASAFAFVCGIICIVFTYSRGGFVGLAVVMLAMAWKSKQRVAGIVGLVLLASALLFLTPDSWLQRMNTIPNAAETDSSAQARIIAWRFATLLALDSPITGGGFDTFTMDLYNHYGFERDIALVAHSIWFQTLAEQGFVGLALFLLLLGSCLVSTFRISHKYRHDHDPELQFLAKYADMIQISILAYCASGTFLAKAYFDLFYELVSIVIALKFLSDSKRRASIVRSCEDSNGGQCQIGDNLMETPAHGDEAP